MPRPQDQDTRAPRRPHQVVLGLGHVGVVRPTEGRVNAQGPGVVPLHLLELALVLAQQGQVVELLGHVRVASAQDLGVKSWDHKSLGSAGVGGPHDAHSRNEGHGLVIGLKWMDGELQEVGGGGQELHGQTGE